MPVWTPLDWGLVVIDKKKNRDRGPFTNEPRNPFCKGVMVNVSARDYTKNGKEGGMIDNRRMVDNARYAHP